MKKLLRNLAAIALLLSGTAAMAQNQYGFPSEIKDGNILHCFDWTMNDVKAELPNIAEAGFVAVQLSPLQRNASVGWNWSDPYRPYDFAFSTSGFGNADNLKALCQEAEKYGIQVIVDVVFNHVDNPGYRNSWWNTGNHLRTGTSYVNYGNRTSITHDRIGDYPDVNSEDPEVIARAKSYIEELKSYGVKGIRFDAAKHIALPSENCDFWKEVTSVPGLFYYGEILDTPGGSNASDLMKEYTEYMSVTDNAYGNTARGMNGVPTSSGNWSLRGIDASKLVFWGESHDTYANTPQYGGVSKNTPQEQIDRAYAIVSCRDKGMGLYFSRPAATDFGQIKVGQKGSTHFKDKSVAEVNKFKNAMVGKAAAYQQNGTTASVSRQGGGAVIVNRNGAGEVSVGNGSGYCPEGTYYDRISGNKFTVTQSTISGKVGSSGIAVIYGDFVPGDDFEGDEGNGNGGTPTGDVYIYTTNPNNWSNVYVYMYVSGTEVNNAAWPGVKMTQEGSLWKYQVPEQFKTNARVIFNNGQGGGSNQYPGKVDSNVEDGYYLNGKSMINDGTGNNNWKEYADAGVSDIFDEEFDMESAAWFNLQGVRISNPSERGIYIVVSPKGQTKKVMIR